MSGPEKSALGTVRAEVARELFPFLRVVYSVAGLLSFAMALATEVPAGRATPSLWIQIGTFGLTALLVWLPMRRGVAAAVIVGGLCVIGLIALLRYGPLGGSAIILVGAAFVGAVFIGARGAVLVGAVGVATYLVASWLVLAGVSPAPDPAGYVPERWSTWARAGVSIAVISTALVYLFERLMEALERLAHRIARSRLDLESSERERERALAALAASQRLASLGQLTAGAAHDFRNALTVVLTGIEELRGRGVSADLEEVLRDVERAARGAEGTARQMVTFGRPGSPRQDGCDPSQVVRDVARTLGRVLPRGIHVGAETADSAPVPLDAPTLSQALLNLSLNARDAMPDGGRLTLRVRPDGPWAAIEVIDTGAGMDAATAARATEPFYTTKEAAGGTGLGLAMVKDVVERAGGTVVIESAPRGGTVVLLRLPVPSVPGAGAAVARTE